MYRTSQWQHEKTEVLEDVRTLLAFQLMAILRKQALLDKPQTLA